MPLGLLAHMDSATAGTAVSQSSWELLTKSWHWDPWALSSVGLALALYTWLGGWRFKKQSCYFVLGNLTILLALVSPIATIGETYLFSVHMLQHLLLEIVAVPLLIIGLPPKIAAWPMRWKLWRRLANVLRHPVLAWFIGVGTLWIWHWPFLYNLTLENRTIHILEHVSFVISATIFWYALLDPIEKYRLPTFSALLYLFSACLINSFLAIILTFAPEPLYPYYQQPRDPFGALHLIREVWGMIPSVDQQLGGAIMWVMGGLIFLGVFIAVLVRWYGQEETELNQKSKLTEEKSR